jgi:hypothetical protein
MEVNGQLHALAALPPGKSSWYPLDRRLGGTIIIIINIIITTTTTTTNY